MQNIIITDLIGWIDENITQALSLDEIVVKSGYYKWYLQRMFKKNGIEYRAICQGKAFIRSGKGFPELTRHHINYCVKIWFESQPTFTRTFRNKFGQAPGRFRKMSGDNHNEVVQLFILEKR